LIRETKLLDRDGRNYQLYLDLGVVAALA